MEVPVIRPPIVGLEYDNTGNEWLEQAACRGIDPEFFFPKRGENIGVIKAVCRACDVRVDCLQLALDTGEKMGVWGGTSERQRRQIKRLGMSAIEAIESGFVDQSRKPGRPSHAEKVNETD